MASSALGVLAHQQTDLDTEGRRNCHYRWTSDITHGRTGRSRIYPTNQPGNRKTPIQSSNPHRTLPPEHPLHTPAKKCATKMVKRHKSLLHKLMQAFNIKPSLFETISTTGGNPARADIRPFKLDIAKNKDASIMADTEGNEKVKIYSDGSAQNGKVGAAAVLVRPGKKPRTLHYHLGTTEHHTVFEAELVGLILGLHLIKTEKTSRTTF